MFYLSVTRLKLKSPRYLLAFLVNTEQIVGQIRSGEGFLQGKLMATFNLSMWTMTLWTSEEASKAFYGSDTHRAAMGKLNQWASEAVHAASVMDWNQLPSWNEVTKLLTEQGHFMPLTHPSNNHLRHFIPQPNYKFTLKI